MTTAIDMQHLPPSELQPNPWNSNRVGPEMEQRLRASIEKFGVYKPIIVRTLSDGALQILGGEHRWRIARDMGMERVPVVNVGAISDTDAKALGLADNGQYGEDDARLLSAILRDIGREEVAELLPYTEDDLAGLFAAADVDLSGLELDDHDAAEPGEPLPDAGKVRPTITHELMRFKVPVEDRERVQKLIERVIADKGFKGEADSMVASGMALVEICNAARDVL